MNWEKISAFCLVHTGFHQFGDGGKAWPIDPGTAYSSLGSQQIWRNLVNSARMRIRRVEIGFFAVFELHS